MNKKLIVHIIFIYLLLVLQITVMDMLQIYSVKPNLLLTYAMCVAILYGPGEGIIVGGVCGVCLDIMSAGYFGMHTILGIITGGLVGYINNKHFKKRIYVTAICVLIYSVIYECIVTVIYMISTGQVDFVYAFRYITIPQGIYNTIASFIIYLLFKLIYYRDEKKASDNLDISMEMEESSKIGLKY